MKNAQNMFPDPKLMSSKCFLPSTVSHSQMAQCLYTIEQENLGKIKINGSVFEERKELRFLSFFMDNECSPLHFEINLAT